MVSTRKECYLPFSPTAFSQLPGKEICDILEYEIAGFKLGFHGATHKQFKLLKLPTQFIPKFSACSYWWWTKISCRSWKCHRTVSYWVILSYIQSESMDITFSFAFDLVSRVLQYTLVFSWYKNKFYKNTQAGICPKFKNRLRTITRLKFWSDKFKNLFNPCTQIEMCM